MTARVKSGQENATDAIEEADLGTTGGVDQETDGLAQGTVIEIGTDVEVPLEISIGKKIEKGKKSLIAGQIDLIMRVSQ